MGDKAARVFARAAGSSAGEQLSLFARPPEPRLPVSIRSLAVHFSQFLRQQPRWHDCGIDDLAPLTAAFEAYIRERLGSELAAETIARIEDYTGQRVVLRLFKEGRLAPEELPPDVAWEFRRRELRALVHEALGRHLKQIRRELEASTESARPDDPEPVPALLARYGCQLMEYLDGLLAEEATRPGATGQLAAVSLPFADK